jgi:di/tricarboxylate transporter
MMSRIVHDDERTVNNHIQRQLRTKLHIQPHCEASTISDGKKTTRSNTVKVMTTDELITLGILAYAIVFFVTEWLRVDVVALSVVVLLMLTEILTTDQAIAGFSSSTVITIAALFIVGGGVLRTDLAGMIGRRILQIAGTSETRLIVTIIIAVALLSGFMSSTGTVAVLLPAILSLSRSAKLSPSKLLMPLAFGSLLGGAMTLIGTPPNIVVSELLQERGMDGFGFFDFTPLGILLLIAGVLYMLVIGGRLLPDHRAHSSQADVTSPTELIELYRLPDNIFRVRVQQRSPLVGQTIAESALRSRHGVTIVEILRQQQPAPTVPIPPLLRNETGRNNTNGNNPRREPIHITPATVLEANDVLLIQGEEAAIGQLVAGQKLALQQRVRHGLEASLISDEVGVAEVLLPARSELVGRTLAKSNFRAKYNLSVLALNRPSGERHTTDLDTVALGTGDTLLVQGQWKSMLMLKEHPSNFVVLGHPEAMMGAPNREKAPFAMAILALMIVVMVSGVVSITLASLAAALLMVLTGCLSMDDAYISIDWKSVVLIAGMLPMSTALEEVGLVTRVATELTDGPGTLSPIFILAALYLITALFTQVLSNTATAVLLAPIAFEVADKLDADPRAFLMAIAMSASMAFASPVASPTNTLVMGAGQYSFTDFAKVGVPLILVTLVISMIALPLLFPF